MIHPSAIFSKDWQRHPTKERPNRLARFRLSGPAQADLAQILAVSTGRWGVQGRRRYAAILAAAMRRVAADPGGPETRDRAEILPDLRSFHVRHARGDDNEVRVRKPVHILYFRVIEPELVEIVRVLHERMEPSRHIDATAESRY
jgi:toxin ParE1/3/4